MSRRAEQTASLIQTVLSNCISRNKTPELLTITRVEVSNDLKNANIWVAAPKNPSWDVQEIRIYLADFINELKKNKLRCIPHLEFHRDDSGDYADKIDKLINKIHES